MSLSKDEKKALQSAAQWIKKLKEETLMPSARHAYEAKRAKIMRESKESTFGLSSGQADQQWVDKSKALQQKISVTKTHQHKTPP
ncbi:MAG: hypothetical protein J7L23_02360 [Candidatus Diapherotrites archaeon]|nr:hypothetical protein [Candidatus Diapherotrites archaeon]